MKKAILFGVLAVVLLFGVIAMASADTSAPFTGTSPVSNSTDPVIVRASVNPKISFTVTCPDATQTVDFGSKDPGTYGGKTVNLSVSSNKGFTLSSTQDLGTGAGSFAGQGITLTRTPGESWTSVKGKDIPFTDGYSITIPWTADPGGPYTASVQYTVTQN